MSATELIFSSIFLFVIYQTVALLLRYIERKNAIRKLEGADLITYLGKAEPKDNTSQKWIWWLLRVGSIALGCGISFCLTPLYSKLGQTPNTVYLVEVVGTGATMILSAIFLIIELLVELKMRK